MKLKFKELQLSLVPCHQRIDLATSWIMGKDETPNIILLAGVYQYSHNNIILLAGIYYSQNNLLNYTQRKKQQQKKQLFLSPLFPRLTVLTTDKVFGYRDKYETSLIAQISECKIFVALA